MLITFELTAVNVYDSTVVFNKVYRNDMIILNLLQLMQDTKLYGYFAPTIREELIESNSS